MSDTSGPTSRAPFAYYDPDESCWRTSQTTFLSGSDLFSATWPRSGMTLGGCAYELPMSVPLTTEPACSSLLPTPAVNDMGANKTVAAWDAWRQRMRDKHGNGNGHGPSLAIEALRLLPTPTARDGKGCREEPVTPGLQLPEAIREMSTGVPIRQRSADGSGSQDDPPLDLLSLLPAEESA